MPELPKFIRKSGFDHESYVSKLQVGFFGDHASSETLLLINREFLSIGSSEFNYENDQDHPNSYYVVHHTAKLAHLTCFTLGCDIFVGVFAKDTPDGQRIRAFTRWGEELHLGTESDLRALLINIHGECIGNSSKRFLMDPMVCRSSDERSKAFEENKRLTLGATLGHARSTPESRANIVIGGAGPEASLKSFESLVKRFYHKDPVAPLVHISYTQTPGKFDSLSYKDLPEGDFGEYYANLNEIINDTFPGGAHLVVPCNTAHATIDQWFYEKMLPNLTIADYRHHLSDHLVELGNVGILGTSATTHTHKIYQLHCESQHSSVSLKISLNPDVVDTAIFLIKSGSEKNRTVAKELILESIKGIRDREGYIPIALCCTELPTVFSGDELKELDLICPSELAIASMGRITPALPGTAPTEPEAPSKPQKIGVKINHAKIPKRLFPVFHRPGI